MRNLIQISLILTFPLLIASCGKGNNSAKPPSKSNGVQVEQSQDPLPDVLTADDMEKLHQNREELINRDSPLGEEHDAILEIQKNHPR